MNASAINEGGEASFRPIQVRMQMSNNLQDYWTKVYQIFIDRIAGAIIRLVASVRPFVGTLLFEPFDL